ncbi:hypothetical protein [Rubinisphaera sp.]|uniref:hypothetical protein n=1 Tax=Rubinisphaera sp. TaxID=2024857 RepID=UPI000C0ECA2A|nr:hypothetical protein [Rubinisphaera sp.]MBV12243.1 hypothetical protein [Rubinisphaera sp.]HCS50399.1 hypothetical protein [Planctomycetaceae bacterium]
MKLFNLAALLLIGILGCGGGGGAKPSGLVPVSGSITLDGSPINSGTVSFIPEDEGPMISGLIQAGRYELKYSSSASGAHPGNYKVVVFSSASDDTMDEQGKPVEGESVVPEKFTNPQSTDLTITVPVEGGTNLDLNLKS